jgi:hypothetical protein
MAQALKRGGFHTVLLSGSGATTFCLSDEAGAHPRQALEAAGLWHVRLAPSPCLLSLALALAPSSRRPILASRGMRQWRRGMATRVCRALGSACRVARHPSCLPCAPPAFIPHAFDSLVAPYISSAGQDHGAGPDSLRLALAGLVSHVTCHVLTLRPCIAPHLECTSSSIAPAEQGG